MYMYIGDVETACGVESHHTANCHGTANLNNKLTSHNLRTTDPRLRFVSRSGIHNTYREHRDLTTAADAVTACYRDMGARHRARTSAIQVIKVEVVPANKC